MHGRTTGIELGCFAQLFGRLLEIALVDKRQREVEVAVPDVRAEANRRSERRNRAVELLMLGEPRTQCAVSVGGRMPGEHPFDFSRAAAVRRHLREGQRATSPEQHPQRASVHDQQCTNGLPRRYNAENPCPPMRFAGLSPCSHTPCSPSQPRTRKSQKPGSRHRRLESSSRTGRKRQVSASCSKTAPRRRSLSWTVFPAASHCSTSTTMATSIFSSPTVRASPAS